MSMQDIRHQPEPVGTLNDFQKLIRCDISTRHGEQDVRFVALECFSLWEHMMRTRHGSECTDYSVSLWIPASEFERQPHVYLHSGNVESVRRFNFNLFDDAYHYTYTASRFVLDEDTERFKNVMLSHVPPEMLESDRFSYEEIPGYCIEKDNVLKRDNLVLGIFNKFHSSY